MKRTKRAASVKELSGVYADQRHRVHDRDHRRTDPSPRPQRHHRGRTSWDAGRGFAVVAGEVKDSAHRTASATQTIRGLVERIQGSSGEAVSAIDVIATRIRDISSFATIIAGAAEQQTAATQEIVVNALGRCRHERGHQILSESPRRRRRGTSARQVLVSVCPLGSVGDLERGGRPLRPSYALPEPPITRRNVNVRPCEHPSPAFARDALGRRVRQGASTDHAGGGREPGIRSAGDDRARCDGACRSLPEPRRLDSVRGTTSNTRYTIRSEVKVLASTGLDGRDATCAALIPIRKTPAWWSPPRASGAPFWRSNPAIEIGLGYSPAVARRLQPCRAWRALRFPLPGSNRPQDADAFEELADRLPPHRPSSTARSTSASAARDRPMGQ